MKLYNGLKSRFTKLYFEWLDKRWKRYKVTIILQEMPSKILITKNYKYMEHNAYPPNEQMRIT